MNEISILEIIFVALLLIMPVIGAYLSWRVLKLMKRVKEIQADRNAVDEERRKKSEELRIKGLEIDRLRREKPDFTTLEKKMILTALKMSQYKDTIEDPNTQHQIRMTYRRLKEKVKKSIKE